MKGGIAALFFVALLGASSGLSIPIRQNAAQLCLSHEDFTRFVNEDDCSQYFQCYRNNAYLLQCPEGYLFNEDVQLCDEPSNISTLNCIILDGSTDEPSADHDDLPPQDAPEDQSDLDQPSSDAPESESDIDQPIGDPSEEPQADDSQPDEESQLEQPESHEVEGEIPSEQVPEDLDGSEPSSPEGEPENEGEPDGLPEGQSEETGPEGTPIEESENIPEGELEGFPENEIHQLPEGENDELSEVPQGEFEVESEDTHEEGPVSDDPPEDAQNEENVSEAENENELESHPEDIVSDGEPDDIDQPQSNNELEEESEAETAQEEEQVSEEPQDVPEGDFESLPGDLVSDGEQEVIEQPQGDDESNPPSDLESEDQHETISENVQSEGDASAADNEQIQGDVVDQQADDSEGSGFLAEDDNNLIDIPLIEEDLEDDMRKAKLKKLA